MRVCVYACMHVGVYACMRVCVYACMHVGVYAYSLFVSCLRKDTGKDTRVWCAFKRV
jgi:hypothetical protein